MHENASTAKEVTEQAGFVFTCWSAWNDNYTLQYLCSKSQSKQLNHCGIFLPCVCVQVFTRIYVFREILTPTSLSISRVQEVSCPFSTSKLFALLCLLIYSPASATCLRHLNSLRVQPFVLHSLYPTLCCLEQDFTMLLNEQ